MQHLKVSLLQSPIIWKSPAANREAFSRLINLCGKEADLIILPEAFSTGFVMDGTIAERMDGETVKWMLQQAKNHQAVICGSLLMEDSGNLYNRFMWVEPDGKLIHYDKKHLFSLAKEEKYFTAGKERVLIDYKGWRIRPLICYDLRFPVWSRNNDDTDLMIYVANWPQKRVYAWQQLLIARAIENQCFVLGVNRTGQEPNGVLYSGESAIIDPMGMVIDSSNEGLQIISQSIEISQRVKIREKIDFQKDRDRFTFL